MDKKFVTYIVITFLVCAIAVILLIVTYNAGYMQCAKDFYNGDIKVDVILDEQDHPKFIFNKNAFFQQ